MEAGSLAACGGPNFPPPEDNLVPAAVAVAPGGPTHVLISDEVAEHIAGCNMAFRRDVLLQLGGFDPVYRAAGDDIDICWRFQDAGYSIGLSAGLLFSRRPVIYSGVFGRGLFQTLYEPPSSLAAFLPLTFEWNVVAIVLALIGLLAGGWALLLLV